MARSKTSDARLPSRLLDGSAIVWICAVAALACRPCAAAERVVLVSVDGLRPDAIDAAPADNMLALIAAGSYHPMAVNDLPPATLPNHTTMLTGLSVATHGIVANTELAGVIEATTIFDVAAGAGLRCGFFASKAKLAFLAPPEALAVAVIESDIAALMDRVLAEMSADPLDLAFIHLRSPDSVGHESGWMSAEYLAAVRSTDEQIGRLLDVLSARELLATTDIIITADHGGEGFGHVLNNPAVRLIPWIGFGPDFAAGRTLCESIIQPDTPATVLMLLGLPVPADWEGRAVVEALATEPQPDCQPADPFLGLPCMVLPVAFGLALAMAFGHWRAHVPANRRTATRHGPRADTRTA